MPWTETKICRHRWEYEDPHCLVAAVTANRVRQTTFILALSGSNCLTV
jgi:hypothetical protein